MMLLKSKWKTLLPQYVNTQMLKRVFVSRFSATALSLLPPELQELPKIISNGIGGLDDLEVSLDQFKVPLTSSLVTQILDSCKTEAPTRRLLRFFLWSCKSSNFELEDQDVNHAIRVFAETKDSMAMELLLSDFAKEGRVMEAHTFSIVAETLVKIGKEDQALGIFRNLQKFKCSYDRVTVSAIVNALCAKGHAKRAEGVLQQHRHRIPGEDSASIYKSLLYGWSVQKNRKEATKEARRILQEMKSNGIMPDLFCYNVFLRCLCRRNLKSNPSGLVPEALNVMMEMRSNEITPTCLSYNVLLSCLGRTRRVKESCQILVLMKKSGCSPDWVSYYLVARVLFLSKRFGKGKQVCEEIITEGLAPEPKFYYDLIGILCAVERVNHALDLFEQMKRLDLGRYGPVYDLLIPKLCRGGDFEKGRELWDEAAEMGVALCCPSDILDPSVTEVFKPTRKVEDVSPVESTKTKSTTQVVKPMRKMRSKRKHNPKIMKRKPLIKKRQKRRKKPKPAA